MFDKILIANRGAIATRIIRTLKTMGIASVAVYAEADEDSLHVLQADEAWSLGNGRASETYLDQDKIFSIIKQTGAQAVHPGYGFLSENPDFVKRCEAEGIAFIGPTADQMQSFGLKHTARELAEANRIPLLPGTGLLDGLEDALKQAEQIGYPVMLKSTAGGGGIGMQLCYSEEELSSSYDSVKRLSQNNFANSGVFLEKFIEYARHIEVQILGDGKGNAIAIGERDCSAQRRNQKVIEETPAANIPDQVRNELYSTATRLVSAINYRNAGTVEFVYDQKQDEFYFLEVNTRLQVEHGVTEQVYGIDLVKSMIQIAASEIDDLSAIERSDKPQGHAIQVRIYAENPGKDFQPSAGLLSEVSFPKADNLRIDHWIQAGIEISPFFDPMLAKVIVTEADRDTACNNLIEVLNQTSIYGIVTNVEYVKHILDTAIFRKGEIYTRYLNNYQYQPTSIDVISSGTMTMIQDFPGRVGYWDVGVPPSGPFDSYSFRLGNRLLGNEESAAGLEITLNGPLLKFNSSTEIVITGAEIDASLDGQSVPLFEVIKVEAGQQLKLGKVNAAGARSYLLVNGGIQCPDYLDSKSTFTLGQFGGHAGRALIAGDVLNITQLNESNDKQLCPANLKPGIAEQWEIRVIYGPHGAPEFFTGDDIQAFFNHDWEIHYNSSRTGIRLVGPKPQWARSDGGEAGMHPSNIHDNAYAFGAIDFTGDMPVILGPDGPSLGGFVCPATVITADLWKLGQLKAGNKVRFIPVSIEDAVALEKTQLQSLRSLQKIDANVTPVKPSTTVMATLTEEKNEVEVVYRPAGDHFLLVEYGPLVLDIAMRFRVHALMLKLRDEAIDGVLELTPGIRSLQVHYNSQKISLDNLIEKLISLEENLSSSQVNEVPARIVHLPLSWDDEACRLAIEKYMQSVRKDAPWCPSNIEFIRRINGLDSIEEVKGIVFDANYLVMGLGDVYLGAPVATPVDPRHRLVTTKYNPARTWTAENSVGIGGSYLCVYGMEGPGGYQFIGRTLQMWNRYKQTSEFEKPWLLRFFDQVKFYEVSAEELIQIRKDFPNGKYSLKIEETVFNLDDYQSFLDEHDKEITRFTGKREHAFEEELQRWIESGQINFESDQDLTITEGEEESLPDNCLAIESPVAGSVWKVLVEAEQKVEEGQPILILESMKMEIEVTAPDKGTIYAIKREEGKQVNAGQSLLILETEKS